MNTSLRTQRIHVAPTRTGWTVSVRAETHAVFVGKRARERAVDWALRLAESLRPHAPVVVVFAGSDGERPPTPTSSTDGGARGRLAS